MPRNAPEGVFSTPAANKLRLLDQHVPTLDRRSSVRHASALGVWLRSIIVEREPIYRQQETVQGFAQRLFGLTAGPRGRRRAHLHRAGAAKK